MFKTCLGHSILDITGWGGCLFLSSCFCAPVCHICLSISLYVSSSARNVHFLLLGASDAQGLCNKRNSQAPRVSPVDLSHPSATETGREIIQISGLRWWLRLNFLSKCVYRRSLGCVCLTVHYVCVLVESNWPTAHVLN